MRAAVVAILAVSVSGCATEPTQVTLAVDTGAGLRATASAVRVAIYGTTAGDPDTTEVTDEHVFGEAEPLSWPVDVAVAPRDGDARRGFRAEIEILGAESVLLTSAVLQGDFIDRTTVHAGLFLPDCCAGRIPCVTGPVADTPLAACDDMPQPVDPPATPPRLIGPTEGALTGSFRDEENLRPTFRFEPVTGALDYEVELERGCAAGNGCAFAGALSFRTSVTSARPPSPLAVATEPPAGDRYAWRVRACNASGCSDWSAPRYLDVGREPYDLDGDGYADLVVGASSGGVVVYPGSGGPPSAGDAVVLAPPADAPSLGASLAVADLDGDGRAEIIAGAPAEGRVQVLRYEARSLTATETLTSSAAGMLDGRRYGAAVAAADLDGDGTREVIVGEPAAGGVGGCVAVHDAGAASASVPSAEVCDELVRAAPVYAIDDVDGDGLFDVLVPARRDGEPFVTVLVGRLLLASRVDRALDITAEGRGLEGMGDSFAPIPGSRIESFVVGAPGADLGAVMVTDCSGAVRSVIFGRDHGGAGIGSALVFLGERDGLLDILVGAEHTAADAGAAFVWSIDADGATLPIRFVGPSAPPAGSRFGETALRIDADGDGLGDAVVGAPGWSGARRGEGRVFVMRATSTGLDGEVVDLPAPAGLGDGFGVFPR